MPGAEGEPSGVAFQWNDLAFDEEIIIRTHMKNARESLVHFGYELVRAEDGALLAEGETTHIVIDKDMKITAIPEKYLTVFRTAMGK